MDVCFPEHACLQLTLLIVFPLALTLYLPTGPACASVPIAWHPIITS